MIEQMAIQDSFYNRLVVDLKSSSADIDKMLKKQIFSHQMMENLINDLLDLAKLENNSFKFSESYFNLTQTIYESLQIILYSAHSRGLNLLVEIDNERNLDFFNEIYGDKRRYVQILLNFLSNAIKFTNDGGNIVISLRVVDSQPA